MKKFTHALIACKAVERLKKVDLSDANKPFANYLLEWFAGHKDGVIRGAWYPDDYIRDNRTSHVYKHTQVVGAIHTNSVSPNDLCERDESPVREDVDTPGDAPTPDVRAYGDTPPPDAADVRAIHELPLPMIPRKLPSTSLEYAIGRNHALFNRPYTIDKNTNLPDRCDALSHAVIDNLRVREAEPKGSPLTQTDNHVALLLFMLSHYVADAHMPMHCDSRKDNFPGFDIHDAAEDVWNREVVRYYKIDRSNQRFVYNESGFPLLVEDDTYADSILKAVDDELARRPFRVGYGRGFCTPERSERCEGNDNVREYMQTVCYYSWLTSLAWLPPGTRKKDVNRGALETAAGLPFRQMSVAALADAIDAVSRVFLHDLRRFCWWKQEAQPS